MATRSPKRLVRERVLRQHNNHSVPKSSSSTFRSHNNFLVQRKLNFAMIVTMLSLCLMNFVLGGLFSESLSLRQGQSSESELISPSVPPRSLLLQQGHHDEISPKDNRDHGSLSSYSFQDIWPTLQNHLCPNMRPFNMLKLGPFLFDQAQKALGSKPDLHTTHIKRNMHFQETFWKGFFYGGVQVTAGRGNPRPRRPHKRKLDYHNHTFPPLPPLPTSSILYLRIWKCANENLVSWFNSLPLHKKFSVTIHELEEEDDGIHFFTNAVNASDPARTCLVTSIRDPIDHFLSGYNEHYYHEIERLYPHDNRGHLVYEPNQNQTKSEIDFVAFVHLLLQEHKNVTGLWTTEHVFPMMRVLTMLSEEFDHLFQQNNNSNEPILSYLPSIQNLTTTWPSFVNQACSNRLRHWNLLNVTNKRRDKNSNTTSPPVFDFARLGSPALDQRNHRTSLDPYGSYLGARSIWKQQGPIAKALCLLHLPDYACWKDLPNGVPPLCQRIYMDTNFLLELSHLTGVVIGSPE